MSNEFAKRLYHFEINPPTSVWDKILFALDQPGTTEEFPSRIYNFQMPPPPGAWEKISSQLYQTGEFKKTVPIIYRSRPYFRYAVAAVFVGIVTFIISFFINKQNIASVAEKESSPVNKQKLISPQPKVGKDNIEKSEVAVLSNHLPEPGKKRLLSMSLLNHGKSSQQLIYHSPATLQTNYSAHNLQNDAEKIYDSPPAVTYDQSKISRINNYVVLLSPDGNIIRISKKFADMIGCIYTSANSANDNCQDQINSWRTKMAKSIVTPSQDNYMDILTMIKSLQDN